MPTKKPFSVTILSLSVLIFTSMMGFRLFEIAKNWDLLIHYNSHPGPIFLSIVSLIWVITGLILILCLIKKYSRSLLLIRIVAYTYILYYWVDRLFLQQDHISHLFPMLITGFMLLFISMLNNNKPTQQYFKQRETHDR